MPEILFQRYRTRHRNHSLREYSERPSPYKSWSSLRSTQSQLRTDNKEPKLFSGIKPPWYSDNRCQERCWETNLQWFPVHNTYRTIDTGMLQIPQIERDFRGRSMLRRLGDLPIAASLRSRMLSGQSTSAKATHVQYQCVTSSRPARS
jgi:hypothetical protein